ncbi:MAG: CoA transferase [Rhodospirillaceae bacterium]|jgi:CoA:oxalate CoA-transferase|nr:CoA transferase [Rhodospirillaceae bacterium]MBT5245368.1 CoA transferase [Rhodospirillaceae bacterium]MBT5562524.1 CoA transferase [Rhodospirillaceae bacterium]MBT6242903.1 CoA transferase [Rhodospirillaceae bacterium]
MKTTGPLSGITVIDLTRVLAGPYCTMVLADLGARVIKVETPAGGDDARHFGPFMGSDDDQKSAYFMSLNRGKESIALNLKDDADKLVFEQLLSEADILVENYRPGTMEKLGYGWDTLSRTYPRLIYAAASGFGHSGPYSKRPAYDLVVQGMGGVMSLTGHPDGEPTRVGTSVGDITAGLFTTIGINAALFHRQQTGRGQKIDVSMLDCQVAILENAIARYAATGEAPGPIGARHPSITPFDAFKASDGHLIIAAGNDTLFANLCEVIGQPDLAKKPLFESNPLRTEHNAALKDELEKALSVKPVAQWLDILEQAGVPSGPINSVDQVLADQQVNARNMIVSAGSLKMAGNPIKMSAFDDPPTRTPAPDLDANRQAIIDNLSKTDD